ncbi:MAG: Serine/threonine-protein kinase PknB [Planctomycetota bacterium]
MSSGAGSPDEPTADLPRGTPAGGPPPGGDYSGVIGGADADAEADALRAMAGAFGRRAGQRIAGFELVDRIDKDANNAFGEVWLARRVEPFQRVAIKFLRRDRVNDELVRRFSRAESKALARFNHPYIARFYELGFDGDTPYLVMQYVPGDRITAYCDKHGLSMRERLELMAKVCDAVQHVHLQGVVHRDLKPANILVSEARPEAEDARDAKEAPGAGDGVAAGKAPIPVLIDFGLAKSVNPDAPLASQVVSGIGSFAGTYAYAAPEQIKQRRDEDTGRQADIYALGAVLFELIVGASPMEHVLSDATLSDPERNLRLANDERPSMAAAYARLAPERQREVAAQRGTTVEAMKRLLRSRLAHLADRALRAKPAARFTDARAFALDIANYLADRDFVEAAAEPRLEKWRRAVRRNRVAFAGVAGVIVALTAGVVATSGALRLASHAAHTAAVARDEALASKGSAQAERALADEARAAAVESTRIAERQRDVARDYAAVSAISQALDAAINGKSEALRRQAELLASLGRDDRFGSRLAVAMGDEACWRWRMEVEPDESAYVSKADFDASGQVLISTYSRSERRLESKNWIRRLDRSSGSLLNSPMNWSALTHDSPTEDSSICFIARGFIAEMSVDGRLRVHDPIEMRPIGKEVAHLGVEKRGLALDARAQVVATLGGDRLIRIWNLQTGLEIHEAIKPSIDASGIMMDAHGSTLVAYGRESGIEVWELSADRHHVIEVRVKDSPAQVLDVSDDGRIIAFLRSNSEIGLVSLNGLEPTVRTLSPEQPNLWGVAVSPDGKRLASTGGSSTVSSAIQVWNIESGQVERVLQGGERRRLGWQGFNTGGEVLVFDLPRSFIYSIEWSADGKSLVTAHDTGEVALWDLSTTDALQHGHAAAVTALAFSPNGDLLASAGSDGRVRFWDTLTGRRAGRSINAGSELLTCIDFAPDESRLVIAGKDKLSIWDMRSRLCIHSKDELMRFSAVGFTREGASLVTLGWESGSPAELWSALDLASGPAASFGNLNAHSPVVFQEDRRRLIAGDVGNHLTAWDLEKRELVWKVGDIDVPESWGAPARIAISADEELLAAAVGRKQDSGIRLFDARTGNRFGVRLGTELRKDFITALAFVGDRTTLASGEASGIIQLWDTATGLPLGDPLRAHVGVVRVLAARPRGDLLASGGHDGIVRLWHASSRAERAGPIRERIANVEVVRRLLEKRLAALTGRVDELDELQGLVMSDDRFAGPLRIPALILIGELEAIYEAQQVARLRSLREARSSRDWPRLLALAAEAREDDLQTVDARFWNELAWYGLTEVAAAAPERDLSRLLKYAERAVELSRREDGSVLDTLARAHWELGDKAKALEIQREAIAVMANRIDENQLAELKATLARYESTEPPNSPAPVQ